jgi:hypothetical protein
VRAGRGRPTAAVAGLVTWMLLTLLGLRFAPAGFVVVFFALGLYLVGPLWIPVAYRVDEAGVERKTAFGARRWTWPELASFELVPAERTGYLYPRGRGSARFLPPVLLMWEADAKVAEPLARTLQSCLEGRVRG